MFLKFLTRSLLRLRDEALEDRDMYTLYTFSHRNSGRKCRLNILSLTVQLYCIISNCNRHLVETSENLFGPTLRFTTIMLSGTGFAFVVSLYMGCASNLGTEYFEFDLF